MKTSGEHVLPDEHQGGLTDSGTQDKMIVECDSLHFG